MTLIHRKRPGDGTAYKHVQPPGLAFHVKIGLDKGSEPRKVQTFQISFAYSLMVLSEENFPAPATFIRHFLAKAMWSR